MKKPLEIYALIVCLFALFYFAVTLGLFLNQAIRVAFPEMTTPITRYDNMNQPNPLNQWQNKAKKENASALKIKTSDQAQAIWEANYKIAILQERRSAWRDLIQQLIGLLISGCILLVHWRLVRKVQKD